MFEMHKKLISHSSFFEGNKRVLFKTRQKVLQHSYETKKIMKITQALVALRITRAKSICLEMPFAKLDGRLDLPEYCIISY